VPVLVAGVTTRRGGREGRPQGEEAQVTDTTWPGGMRNADHQHGTGCPPWTWHTRHARGIRSLESHVHRKVSAWFGGRVRGKGFPTEGKHLAVHPTLFLVPKTAVSAAKGTETAIMNAWRQAAPEHTPRVWPCAPRLSAQRHDQ
jgi:hypothetical protein